LIKFSLRKSIANKKVILSKVTETLKLVEVSELAGAKSSKRPRREEESSKGKKFTHGEKFEQLLAASKLAKG
jgi:hypothetical protein